MRPSLRVEKKAWGWAYHVFSDTQIEVVRVLIDPGGKSSIHWHASKHNLFVAVQGTLIVRVFAKDYPAVSSPAYETLLHGSRPDGNAVDLVKAGIPHQFEAVTRFTGYELYFPAAVGLPLRIDDIVRLTQSPLLERTHAP